MAFGLRWLLCVLGAVLCVQLYMFTYYTKDGKRLNQSLWSKASVLAPVKPDNYSFVPKEVYPAVRAPSVSALKETLHLKPPLFSQMQNLTFALDSSLPAFSVDFSEFALGSIVEREHGSFNLILNTFFVCHRLFRKHKSQSWGADFLNPQYQHQWTKFKAQSEKKKHFENGMRDPAEPFRCRIKYSSSSHPFLVDGFFLPNRLSSDSNTNNHLDVLRCPMPAIGSKYVQLSRSNEVILIDILVGSKLLLSFEVPWRHRQTGFLLSSPAEANKYDPWKAFDLPQPPDKIDLIHVCVPGVFLSFDHPKYALYKLVSFLSHHKRLGVNHIYIPMPFGWTSPRMHTILTFLSSFIEDGFVSVTSQSDDGLDFVSSVRGLSWSKASVRTFQANLCLFQAKGVADYLIMLDLDDLFQPSTGYSDIASVMVAVDSAVIPPPWTAHSSNKLENIEKSWRGGNGWADGHGHPLCFLSVPTSSENDSLESKSVNGFSIPIYEANSSKKLIVPSRRIFQGGVYAVGACSLSGGWNGCKDQNRTPFCGIAQGSVNKPSRDSRGWLSQFKISHSFFELVQQWDGKAVNIATIVPNVDHKYDSFVEHLIASNRPRFNALGSNLTNRFHDWVRLINDGTNVDMKNDETSFLSRESGRDRVVSLPSFAWDLSEYVLSAIIERKSNSYDLWVSTFFLCHWMLEPKNDVGAQGAISVNPFKKSLWEAAMTKFAKTEYFETGERRTLSNYSCRISHDQQSKPYLVEGKFIPNRLSPDSNGNRRLDILRCKMQYVEEAYAQFAGKNISLLVEIFRGPDIVISFLVPWSTRQTGYLLSPSKTRFDAWKGFDISVQPKYWTYDDMYLCVPGLETPVSRHMLPLYLEFIQHHLLLGVKHIFLAAAFDFQGTNMRLLTRVLQSFIDNGSVSIVSSAGDDLDFAYSVGGLLWARDNVKVFHVNMCSYLAKGTANYVGIWDLDEFFVPKGGNQNIKDVINSMDPQSISLKSIDNRSSSEMESLWFGGRGWADRDGHPLCYLRLTSESIFFKRSKQHDGGSLWIGENFNHGSEPAGGPMSFQKSIWPTRKIFYGGLHLAGSCQLPRPWTDCQDDQNDFCWAQGEDHGHAMRVSQQKDGSYRNFHLDHRIDEMVFESDSKKLRSDVDAVIHHFQFHRQWLAASKNTSDFLNDYSSFYFPSVRDALDKRGLAFLIDIPETSAPPYPLPDYSWIPVSDLNEDSAPQSTTGCWDSQQISSLPAWGKDCSELFLVSVVDEDVLSVMVLTHNITQYIPSLKVHQKRSDTWKRFQRSPPTKSLTCLVSNRLQGSCQTTSTRTPCDKTKPYADCFDFSFSGLSMYSGSIQVDCFSGSLKIISFLIDLKSRTTWASFQPSLLFTLSAEKQVFADKFYLLANGIDLPPSRLSVPSYLEFVEHHLQLGFDHILLNVPFTKSSVELRLLVHSLSSFVASRRLSFLPECISTNFLTDVLGVSLGSIFFDFLHLNLLSRLFKNNVQAIGTWSFQYYLVNKLFSAGGGAGGSVGNDYSGSLSNFTGIHHKCVCLRSLYASNTLSDLDQVEWNGIKFKEMISVFSSNVCAGSILSLSEGYLNSSNSDVCVEEDSWVLEHISPSRVVRGGSTGGVKCVYCAYYFPRTLTSLLSRDADLIVTIPMESEIPPVATDWLSYDIVYESNIS